LSSVIQSEIFNRFLVARSELGRERVLLGDVVRLGGSHSLFVVEDPGAEQPRLDSGDIHLTGPMLGPKMKASAGRPRELEIEATASLGLSDEALSELGRSAPGTRRDLVLRPEEIRHEVAAEDGSLTLDFTLPAGAYATLVVRAFTRRDLWPVSEGDKSGARGRMDHVED
jgi:tRNA pseudouridine13 synthase